MKLLWVFFFVWFVTLDQAAPLLFKQSPSQRSHKVRPGPPGPGGRPPRNNPHNNHHHHPPPHPPHPSGHPPPPPNFNPNNLHASHSMNHNQIVPNNNLNNNHNRPPQHHPHNNHNNNHPPHPHHHGPPPPGHGHGNGHGPGPGPSHGHGRPPPPHHHHKHHPHPPKNFNSFPPPQGLSGPGRFLPKPSSSNRHPHRVRPPPPPRPPHHPLNGHRNHHGPPPPPPHHPHQHQQPPPPHQLNHNNNNHNNQNPNPNQVVHGGNIFNGNTNPPPSHNNPNNENNPGPLFTGPPDIFKQSEIPESFKNMENFMNQHHHSGENHNNNNNNNHGPSTSFGSGSPHDNNNNKNHQHNNPLSFTITKPSFETDFPLPSGAISNSIDTISQPTIHPAPHIILNPNPGPFGGLGISLATGQFHDQENLNQIISSMEAHGQSNLFQGPGGSDNDNEHGWTAATYKGWRPIAKPPSYYTDRQNKQNQNQNQQQHLQPHSSPSQHFPVSFLPFPSSSATSTTEQYRDVGGKHKKLMMTTLFRDNVKSVKPESPVKLKPEFDIIQSQSSSHSAQSHSSSQSSTQGHTPPPTTQAMTSTTTSSSHLNQNHGGHGHGPGGHRDPGVMIPLPDEVGAGPGIRLPTNLFYDDFGSQHNSHLEFPTSFSNQNSHNHPSFPPSGSSNGNSHANDHHNLVPSQSEDTPVRKPFSRFRTTTAAPINDTHEAPSLNQNGQSNAFLNKYKSKRPKFQRPLLNQQKIRNQHQNQNNPDESDEVGPPKVNVPNSSESIDRPLNHHIMKHKLHKQRNRIRGGNPNPLESNSNSNQNSNLKKPDAYVSTEEVGQALQSQNQREKGGDNSGQGRPHHGQQQQQQQPGSGSYSEESSNENLRPPGTNGSSINFPHPPLYGGGYYGDGHPLAPPPTFFDSLNSPFFNDGAYAGPPVTVVPTNGNKAHGGSNANSGSGSGQSSENIQNIKSTTPSIFQGERAGPVRKKKVRTQQNQHQNQNQQNQNQHRESGNENGKEKQRHPRPQQQQQQNNVKNEEHNNKVHGINYNPPSVNIHNGGVVASNEDSGPLYTPQGTFYFPSEFTEMSNSGEHQAVSFMTMPGSRPQVISHQALEFQQNQNHQQQQQQQQKPHQHHHQNNIFQHSHQQPPQHLNGNNINNNNGNRQPSSYPINILRSPNFPPPPPHSNNGPNPHHPRFPPPPPSNNVSPSTPPFLQYYSSSSSSSPPGFPPAGPSSTPNILHQQQRQQKYRPGIGPGPESTTIRNHIIQQQQNGSPFTPNPNLHDVTFNGQYGPTGNGHLNNFANHGEIYQRQPTNSYKYPASGPGGPPGNGQFNPNQHRGQLPPPPPPPHHGQRHPPPPMPPQLPMQSPPVHINGGPGRHPPPQINHQHQHHPSSTINPQYQNQNQNHAAIISSAEQYERIPMDFLNHLQPILLDDSSSLQISPATSSPTHHQSTSTLRSTYPMTSSPGTTTHVYHSPNVHPPGQYFDDFFKPFQSHEHYHLPPGQNHQSQSQEQSSSSSTEKHTYPSRGGHVTNQQNQGHKSKIAFPNNKNQHQANSHPFDSQKSPSVQFEQFLRPNEPNLFIPPTQFQYQVENDINLNHLQKDSPIFSVSPVQDFSTFVTTISPILEHNSYFHAKSPKVWSKLKPGNPNSNEDGNGNGQIKIHDFIDYPSSTSTESQPQYSSMEPETVTIDHDQVYILNPDPPTRATPTVFTLKPDLINQNDSEGEFSPSLFFTTENHRPKFASQSKHPNQEIRATHRPVYQRPTTPATPSKPSTPSSTAYERENSSSGNKIGSAFPESLKLTTTTTSASASSETLTGLNSLNSNENGGQGQSQAQGQETSHQHYSNFDHIIPRNPFSDSSNENVQDNSYNENDNSEDENNIPNSFRNRYNKLSLSTVAGSTTASAPSASAASTTLPPSSEVSSTTEDQSEVPSTTFTSKRYMKRRRPAGSGPYGHGHSGQLSRGGHGAAAGYGPNGKRYFSSKVSQNQNVSSSSSSSEEAAAAEKAEKDRIRSNNPYIIRKQQLPKHHQVEQIKDNGLNSDPPITTHRPQRRFRPTTQASLGSISNEEIVTQPFIYPKRKLFQKRIRNFPPAARLGLPAKDNNNDNSHHNHEHDQEKEESINHHVALEHETNHNHNNHHSAAGSELVLKRPSSSKGKFTRTSSSSPVFSSSNKKNVLLTRDIETTTTTTGGIVSSTADGESTSSNSNTTPHSDAPSASPESAVTYGESQWFRIKNSFNQGHGHDDDASTLDLKKIKNHGDGSSIRKEGNNDVNNENEAHSGSGSGKDKKDRVVVTMSSSISSSSELLQHGDVSPVPPNRSHRLVTPGSGGAYGQRRRPLKRPLQNKLLLNRSSNENHKDAGVGSVEIESVSFSPVYRKNPHHIRTIAPTTTVKSVVGPKFESLAGPSAEALTSIEKEITNSVKGMTEGQGHHESSSMEMLPEPAALSGPGPAPSFPLQQPQELQMQLAEHLQPQQLDRQLVARPRFINDDISPFHPLSHLMSMQMLPPSPQQQQQFQFQQQAPMYPQQFSVVENVSPGDVDMSSTVISTSTLPSTSTTTMTGEEEEVHSVANTTDNTNVNNASTVQTSK